MNEEQKLDLLKGLLPPVSEVLPAIMITVRTPTAHDHFRKLHTFSSIHRGSWTVVTPSPRGQEFIADDHLTAMIDPDNSESPSTRRVRRQPQATAHMYLRDYEKFPLTPEHRVDAAILAVILTAVADGATSDQQQFVIDLGALIASVREHTAGIRSVAALPEEKRRRAEPALYTIIRQTVC